MDKYLGAFGPLGCIWIKPSVLGIYLIHMFIVVCISVVRLLIINDNYMIIFVSCGPLNN